MKKIIFFLSILFIFTACSILHNNPRYYTRSDEYHYVQRGETLDSICNKYSIPKEKLKIFNNLKSDKIFVGQKIYLSPRPVFKSEFVTIRQIPKSKFHIVKKNESIQRISKIYNVTVIELIEFNSLKTMKLKQGQKIWLVSRETSNKSKPEIQSSKPKKQVVNKKQPQKTSLSKPTNFMFPLQGKITSKFGLRNGRHHKGVDISAKKGSPIVSSNSGKVVFSGSQRGYGNVVIIEHPGYIMTVYAHNESNLVRLGEMVKKGQPIATVGDTGKATGPHLHFEYRVNGKAIDPLTVISNI